MHSKFFCFAIMNYKFECVWYSSIKTLLNGVFSSLTIVKTLHESKWQFWAGKSLLLHQFREKRKNLNHQCDGKELNYRFLDHDHPTFSSNSDVALRCVRIHIWKVISCPLNITHFNMVYIRNDLFLTSMSISNYLSMGSKTENWSCMLK